MGLRTRMQQIEQRTRGGSEQRQAFQQQGQEQAKPIQLSATPYFAIVDGELVNVLGTTDIPGMSPAYWCADVNGDSAPVSVLETKIFTTAQEALRHLEQQRSGVQTSYAGQR